MSQKTLNQILGETILNHPEDTAFFYKEEVLSYRELGQRIDRCTVGLQKLGIREGDTFGVVVRNCPEFVILFFALARLGAATVPVNFLEKGEKLGFIFNDAQVKGCLTSREFLKNVKTGQTKAPSLRHIFLKDNGGAERPFNDLIADAGPATGLPEMTPDRLVLLIYTAGTTGTSKGVMLTHKNFCANLESCRGAIELKQEDRFLCLLPMFHSFAWTANVLLPLRLGASTVIMETLLPFDPVIKAIWKYKITIFCGVPPIFAALVQKVRGIKALIIRMINPVRVAVSGAAPLPAPVHKAFERTFGIPLLEGYGLTETSPVVTLNPLHGKRKSGTVGKSIPNVHIKIVDDEEKAVAQGQVGEVLVKGENVMQGYYNRPQETQESFTKDGWFKTGDLGRLDDEGYLAIVDRKKDLIIVKGLNVYPQEIENVLLSHPSVAEAAAVGIADQSGDEIIKAFVTMNPGQSADRSDLLKLCRDNLANYKIPRDIEIRKELPKNTLGKILKRDLRREAGSR